jgi:N-acetylmuramoyl-L-alanine amidase
VRADLAVGALEHGEFGDRTEEAVRAFQRSRGLTDDGICDDVTWSALVEAGWRLGDRLLFLSAPNMRGDDVVEMQTHLARLGFDCGRIDGICGPDTIEALRDFQRNSGLPDDGVCGHDTVHALEVLGRQSGSGPGVVSVREVVRLTTGNRSLSHLRIVIGEFGGYSALARQVVIALRQRSAAAITVSDPDPLAQARTANRFSAHAFVGFEAVSEQRSVIHHFAVAEFESTGGRSLARHIAENAPRELRAEPIERIGMRLPILRETRMPAVLWRVGPVDRIVELTPRIAATVVRGVEQWRTDPVDGDSVADGAT